MAEKTHTFDVAPMSTAALKLKDIPGVDVGDTLLGVTVEVSDSQPIVKPSDAVPYAQAAFPITTTPGPVAGGSHVCRITAPIIDIAQTSRTEGMAWRLSIPAGHTIGGLDSISVQNNNPAHTLTIAVTVHYA